MKEYYAFRIQQLSEGHTLISGGRLLQQYVVDAYCCIERIHLRWIQKYEYRLRIEIYIVALKIQYDGKTQLEETSN